LLLKLSINLTNLKIAGGAKIDCVDKDGFTPLHRCCQEKPTSKDGEISGEKLDFKNRFYTSIFYCNSIFLFCNTQSLKLLAYKLIFGRYFAQNWNCSYTHTL
jgi:hypothetical protein